MKPLTYFDKFGQQACLHGCGVLKLEMRANAALAAGCFWQVHDFAPSAGVAAPPNTTSVPLKSWPAYAGASDYKEFKEGELVLTNGLYVCMSTTEATKTLGTGSNKLAMLSVELERADDVAAVTAVDDASAALEVWNEATGAAGDKRLILARVANLEATVAYLMLFAVDTPAEGAKPVQEWELAATGDADGQDEIELYFGAGRKVQSLASGALAQGCRFVLSTTPNVLTTAATGMNIYAEYL